MERRSMSDAVTPEATGGRGPSPEVIARVLQELRQSEDKFRATMGLSSSQATTDSRRAKADARFRELMFSAEAITLVRSRERAAYASAPGIPLYCADHRTGVALVLMVNNEIDEGTPVPDHILMLCQADPKAGAVGTAVQGKSCAVRCGTCGRSTSRQDAWLLERALKCLDAADTQARKGYRITIT
jgi:hypothetical protein